MLRTSWVHRCTFPAATETRTLSQWLSAIAINATALPDLSVSSEASCKGNPSSSTSGTAAHVWSEIAQVAPHAFALKETDTLFSIVQCLLLKKIYPPSLDSWPALTEQLLFFSDVEATSVLRYPGIPDATYRYLAGASTLALSSSLPSSPSYSSSSTTFSKRLTCAPQPLFDDVSSALGLSAASMMMQRSVPLAHRRSEGQIGRSSERGTVQSVSPLYVAASRETLVLADGVVPVSARLPCADGGSVACLIDSFIGHYVHVVHDDATVVPSLDGRRAVLEDMNAALLSVLARNEATLHVDAVGDAIPQYMHILFSFDMESSSRDVAGSQSTAQPKNTLLYAFTRDVCERLSHNVLGARLCLLYLSTYYAGVKHEGSRSGGGNENLSFDPSAQRLYLHMLRIACKAVRMYYTADHLAIVTSPAVSLAAPPPTALSIKEGLAPLLRSIYDALDLTFQNNANNGNALHFVDGTERTLRLDVSTALMRALRMEANTPDAFLRDAMALVDRCDASMAIEGELIAGKVRLLEYFDLDEEARDAIYGDVVTSLRNLVTLRPRVTEDNKKIAQSEWDDAADVEEAGQTTADSVPSSAFTYQTSTEDEIDASGPAKMNKATRAIMQAAHEDVIKALCSSYNEERINEAYGIVVAHKYHGLKVTKEVIRPLMEVLSRRGDCRVFNLVDLCVLYSNSEVDMDTIGYLFRACAVAGDYYRACTLLQLIKEVVPGFLVKATDSIRESLRELKVLEPEPFHLFVSDEMKLVKSALGEAGATLRDLPCSTNKQE